MCRIVEITSIHSYIVNLSCHSVISQAEFGKLKIEMKSLAGLQKQVLINKAEFSVLFCFFCQKCMDISDRLNSDTWECDCMGSSSLSSFRIA